MAKGTSRTTNLVNAYIFIFPTLIYTANNVDLLMRQNDVSFSSVGETHNERAAGSGLDNIPETDQVVQAMEQLNGNEARKGLNSLRVNFTPRPVTHSFRKDFVLNKL